MAATAPAEPTAPVSWAAAIVAAGASEAASRVASHESRVAETDSGIHGVGLDDLTTVTRD